MAAMKKKKRKMGNDKTTICKQIWTRCSIGLVAWNHRHSYQSEVITQMCVDLTAL
jgi:hypothetical protein